MTFSSAMDEFFHAVFIKNPSDSYNYQAYTSPLTNSTWLLLFVWIIATPPILFIVAR